MKRVPRNRKLRIIRPREREERKEKDKWKRIKIVFI
jgi:hypothetical protein